jgi:type II secretory pathway component PulF
MFIRLVSVGEETGNLDGSLQEAAEHIQRVADLSSALKQAMIYPLFAFVTTFGSMIFWLVYVLPKITSLFKDMGVKVPAITRFLILMSAFTRQYWPLLVILPILFFTAIRLVRRSERGAYLLDQAMLRLPIVQLILVNKSLGIFTEQMRILLRSGLTIDRCFDLAGGVIGNRVYKDAIGRVKQEVLAGATISEAMALQRVFPPMMLRMVHVGETSGTLDEQFAFLAAYYVKKLDDVSKRLGKLLEPIMIITLGIMFAVIILGLLLPIYDLISNIGRM